MCVLLPKENRNKNTNTKEIPTNTASPRSAADSHLMEKCLYGSFDHLRNTFIDIRFPLSGHWENALTSLWNSALQPCRVSSGKRLLTAMLLNGFLRAAQGQGLELQEADFSITRPGMEMIDLGDSSFYLSHHYKLPICTWPWMEVGGWVLYKGTSNQGALECQS